jgi:hypothetical protein
MNRTQLNVISFAIWLCGAGGVGRMYHSDLPTAWIATVGI